MRWERARRGCSSGGACGGCSRSRAAELFLRGSGGGGDDDDDDAEARYGCGCGWAAADEDGVGVAALGLAVGDFLLGLGGGGFFSRRRSVVMSFRKSSENNAIIRNGEWRESLGQTLSTHAGHPETNLDSSDRVPQCYRATQCRAGGAEWSTV